MNLGTLKRPSVMNASRFTDSLVSSADISCTLFLYSLEDTGAGSTGVRAGLRAGYAVTASTQSKLLEGIQRSEATGYPMFVSPKPVASLASLTRRMKRCKQKRDRLGENSLLLHNLQTRHFLEAHATLAGSDQVALMRLDSLRREEKPLTGFVRALPETRKLADAFAHRAGFYSEAVGELLDVVGAAAKVPSRHLTQALTLALHTLTACDVGRTRFNCRLNVLIQEHEHRVFFGLTLCEHGDTPMRFRESIANLTLEDFDSIQAMNECDIRSIHRRQPRQASEILQSKPLQRECACRVVSTGRSMSNCHRRVISLLGLMKVSIESAHETSLRSPERHSQRNHRDSGRAAWRSSLEHLFDYVKHCERLTWFNPFSANSRCSYWFALRRVRCTGDRSYSRSFVRNRYRSRSGYYRAGNDGNARIAS